MKRSTWTAIITLSLLLIVALGCEGVHAQQPEPQSAVMPAPYDSCPAGYLCRVIQWLPAGATQWEPIYYVHADGIKTVQYMIIGRVVAVKPHRPRRLRQHAQSARQRSFPAPVPLACPTCAPCQSAEDLELGRPYSHKCNIISAEEQEARFAAQDGAAKRTLTRRKAQASPPGTPSSYTHTPVTINGKSYDLVTHVVTVKKKKVVRVVDLILNEF